MPQLITRSAGMCFAVLLVLLAAVSPASSACTLNVLKSGTASQASGVYVMNDEAYIASSTGHLIVMPLSSMTSSHDWNVGGTTFDVFVSGSTAYMTDYYSIKGVKVVNADTGVLLGEGANWNSNLHAIGIYISGSYAYVGATDYTNGKLVVLSLADPDLPTVMNTISSGPMASGGGGLCVADGKIYLATDNGVDVFSISTPGNPTFVETISIADGTYDVHVFGTNAYVVQGTNVAPGLPNVKVLDLSNPGTPTNCYIDSDPPYAIQFYGGKIYIVDPNGLKELSVGSGSLTVTLDVIPNDAQDFSFAGADLGSFILDDDSDSTYSNTKTFSNMAAGDYVFRQNIISGWLLSSITASDPSKVMYSSDGGVSNPWHSSRTAADTWVKASVQAGSSLTVSFQDTKMSSISGHVIYDLNGDGIRNNLEGFVADGWKLELWKDGTKTTETTTLSGAYSFNNLAPGNYEVRSASPDGWVNTTPVNGRRTYSSLSTDQTNQDFGACGSLSISGHVIYDLDGSGTRNNLESFVSNGWKLELYKDGTKIAENTTFNGAYAFGSLAPGSYEVRSVLLAGWVNTLPANGRRTYSSLTAVQTDQDLGARGSLSISGSVIYDLDGSGTRNNLESFVADGWKLELYKDGTKIAENTTLSGAYAFNNLAAGSYEVRSVLLAGWVNTLPTNGRRTYSSLTTVQTNQDFGVRGSLSISGQVIYDLDGSGTRNNSEGFVANGWKLELYKDGTKIAENTTLSGDYAFNNLITGSYEVRSVLPAGWANTLPANGRRTYPSLTTVQTNQDFGARGSLSISGEVIYDLDGSGTRNNLEIFVADGWKLELYKDGTKIAENTTLSGDYAFNNLAAGSYEVRSVLLAGWANTLPANGRRTYSSLTTVQTNQDFGARGSLSISGQVIYDLDGSGTRNNSEGFVANGWKLELYKDGIKIAENTTLSGDYAFNNLITGSYEVRSVLPAGWANTLPANGRRTYSSLTTVQTNQDFGARGSLSISGEVIYDLDGSGTRNNLEIFVADGWKLELYKDGTKIAENTTLSGEYAFNNLANGSYEVRSVLLAGWATTLPANGRRTYSSLTTVQTNQDFGARGSLSISGQVIYDLDGSGTRNNLESFVADGWMLELYKDGIKIAENTTLSGDYAFYNLITGSYEVRSVLLAGWANTLPANGRRTYSSLTTVQTNQDFGARGSLSISGHVIYDLDGSGTRNNLESFVADGWKLELYKDGTKIAENTTLSGDYAFNNLANGSYEVRSVLLAGWANTLPANGRRTYSSLTTVQTNQDFGARGSLSISGQVIYDLDGSGTRNNLESFVADGWKLELYKDGTKIAENTTVSGDYAFNNLAAGSYEVRSVLLAGWANTLPANGRRTYSSLTTVQTNQDFGARGSLSISGHVIYDLDGSGVRNNSEGFVSDGWKLELYKDGTKIAENTTQSGDYAFNNLAAGSYEVRSVLLAGWANTLPANGRRTYLSLTTVQTNQDFGTRGIQSIAGMKFHDLNGDGIKDTDEPGLEAWTIELKKDGTEIASVKTDANGGYSFSGIAPGSYTVEEAVNSSWTQSYPASPGVQNVTLVSGVAGPTDINFGNWRSTGFSGMKFEDQNGNGAKDSGEPGLKGWTIRLMKGGTEVASTVTAVGGAYSFSGIAPGNYTVEEAVNSSWTQSYPASPGTQNVTLVSGVAGPTDVNFGNWRSTGFSGMKFGDNNGNGVKDSGEPGLKGWTIRLMKGSTEVISTQTDANGAYSFSGLAPGSYTVEEAVNSSWTQSYPASPGTQNVTLVSGVAGPTDINFGNWRSTGFSGMKFEDQNGNGAKDSGEPGVIGWTIRLMKGSTEVASIVTAAGGAYSFSGLAPGSYIVEEVVNSSWTQSYPASPGSQAVTLVSGVAGPNDIDFGNWRTTGFSGMKFEDLNGNGAKDSGEPGLPGWTIRLMKGSTEVASTLTDANGAYSFSGLAPGSYIVEEVVNSSWTQSYPASPGSQAVTLVSGVAGPNDIDFGNWRTTGFSGMKFEDLNGNGAKDSGEPGLIGWTIRLMKGSTEVASTVTAAGGAYSFSGIAPGSYTVEEAVNSSWTQSYPASPGSQAVTLVSGVAGPTDINFGNWRSTGFSGMKFEDLNGNGAKDSGEPGVIGWTIRLMKGSTEVASTVTAAGGAYSFSGIAPGSYTVEEAVNSSWTQSYPASPGTQNVTLVSGVAGPTDINFGNWRSTGFSGMKFEDLNGNGARDSGESGVIGWTIRLMKGSTEVTSTQTDANGDYSFSGIAPGSYTVEEAVNSSWTQSYPASPGTQNVTLVSGLAGPTDINFGNWRSTGFSGMKFEDLNDNGAKDSGEPGLIGWTIRLMKGSTELASTLTDANGDYSFSGIAPGSYTVEEAVNSSWTQSYPASGIQSVTLVSGVAGPTDVDFGNWRSTGFSGMKFEDLNGNGAKDSGELGLAGWNIRLMKGGTEVASTLTDANGAYSFSGIAPGSYTVEEAVKSSWTQSYPASPGTQNVTLVSGVAGPTDINFGNWRSTGFSGMKFEDLNGNGARDSGEPGLIGWTIRLMKGSTEVTSTQTDANGAYSFSGIAPGSYTVEEVVNSSWTQSYPASPGTQNVTLVSGVAGPTDINFGNWRSTGFSGMKFEDLDRNGAKDSGEPGLPGWTIKVKQGSTEVASTLTAAGGAYSFSGLAPGSYTVEEVINGSWTQSYPASPGTQTVTLVSGVAGPTDINFGNWRSTGFSGMKFEDQNGNGVKDSGEPGLPGWTIKVKQGSTEVARNQTNANGAYSFSGLPPGSYTVEEVVNSSWTQSYPASGTQTLTLFSGVAGPKDVDFGNWHSTGFSGMKFEDLNGNGAKDSGEPGVIGWTIRLMKGSTEVASTVTAAGGAYSFTGLQPGSYTVEEVVNSNWTQSYPASGTQTVTLVSGVAGRNDIDFGNWRTTGFSGMKFEDLNGNGAKDIGEPGLAGWTIKLKQGAKNITSTQTDANGAYSFTGIAPGTYMVEEEGQGGWTQSYPGTGTQNVNLTSGVAGPTDINFGNWRTTGFSGMKFEDLNGNGAKDSGEPGLAGWTIKVKKDGTEINKSLTDANGTYSFTGIAPGSYTVEEEGQGGWTQSYPASGTQNVTLVSGATGRSDIDFGNWRATGFSGVKFEDVNGDGARDGSEQGLAGWTIKVKQGSTEVTSTVTNSSGAYSFSGLAPGIYTVEEEDNSSWKQTSPAGDVYTAVCSSGQTAITKADLSAVAASEVNFGNRKLVEAFSVNITANRQTVQPGQDLVFNITITRLGDIVLNSLGTEYTLPKGLKFVSSNPSPQSIIENADGTTTLIWTDLAFSSMIAARTTESQAVQSSSPSTTLTVITQVQPGAPEILTGTVAVTGSASQVAIAEVKATVTVEVQSLPLHPISLNKTSDLKEVWPGATVAYTITYESNVFTNLTNVTITEQASSDLIFLSATPAPDAGTENVWSIGKLPDHGKGTIQVLFLVKNDSNLSFDSQSSVSGSGFVNSYRRLSTETQSGGLKNSVTLTCDQFTPVSTSYSVKLRDSEGTSLLKKEHGSGEYRSEEKAALQMENRSIKSISSLQAVYRPTSFSLPGNKSINYDSEISSLTITRNRATKASTSQEFRYARSLEMEQQLLLDKNETTMSIEAKVQGQAHLGVLKKDGEAVKPLPVFESSQDYAGTYRINQSLQDYGSNVRMIRNATGLGQAASDQRLKKSQRSFEHGSGSYQSEEQVSTAESYIGKDLVVNYDPQYGYGKWKAGIWSKSSGQSYLGQEITGADYIREETIASGLNDMSTNLSFQGKARLRAVSKSARSEVDKDEEYVGQFSLQRRVHLGGVSRFDRPHLTLNKTGQLVPGTAAAEYTITVLNDGNAALGPVYVWDIFPAGTDYLGSSLKPARLQPGYANWSLLYLGIGQLVNISLRLNVTDPGEELLNVVYASGGHNGEWVTAGNMSIVQLGWLGCCQPNILVEKQARIDAVDNRLIWYRILLKNQANVSLVAKVTDRLPAGLRLLNASAEPQIEGLDLGWVTTAIPAGESRFIEYLAQATQNGKFVNTARVEAHALDGSGGASAAASSTVTVGEATSYAENGWRPPEWGLDRSEMICDDTIAGDGASCSCPA